MTSHEKGYVDRCIALAFRLWTAISVVFVLVNGGLYLSKGANVFDSLMQVGPCSILEITLASVAVVWLSVGVSLAFLRNALFRSEHGIALVCTLFAILLYANILRERITYGDVGSYVAAAHDLANHVPFHERYLYPPFFATVLVPLLPLGDVGIMGLCWFANLFSLGVFSVLLVSVLARYGYDRRISGLLTILFLAVNVPVLRTLGYVQVNLHVTNLILLTLLCYPRFPILSALALAIAVHLKTSPIILALPFLLCRDWRWTVWFGIITIGLVGVTVVPYGWDPFGAYLNNIHNIYSANGLCFRENSIDSLFRGAAFLIGIPLDSLSWPIGIAKTGVLVMVLLTMVRAMKNKVFARTCQMSNSVHDGVPVLMIFMLLGSPLVWEHHPVFVALPFLLMIKCLDTSVECVLYGFAYFAAYLMPTFDFFPWSYGRLLSPLILLGLIYVASKRTRDGYLFSALNSRKFIFTP